MKLPSLFTLATVAGSLSLLAADQPATPPSASPSQNPALQPSAATTGQPPAPVRGGRRGGLPPMGLPPTIAPDAKVTKLATLPTESYTVDGAPFTEGASVAPNGDIYFVEQNSNKIMHWNVADKTLSVFMHPAGYSNGMAFDSKGNLISCADERNELWSISLTEKETIPYPQPLNPAFGDPNRSGNITLPKHTVLVKDYQGKLLGGPNDVWIRPDGGMYLTDPFYARKWWAPGRQSEQVDKDGKPFKTVFFLSPDHKTLTRVVSDYNTPNGIIGTPDGKTLYVADIGANETYGFDIQPDGSLTNKRLICKIGSDGMTLDNKGNLYLSSGGVQVVDTKTGERIGSIQVPEQPANMAFGGPDRSTLYFTARTGFYSIPTLVKGANTNK